MYVRVSLSESLTICFSSREVCVCVSKRDALYYFVFTYTHVSTYPISTLLSTYLFSLQFFPPVDRLLGRKFENFMMSLETFLFQGRYTMSIQLYSL